MQRGCERNGIAMTEDVHIEGWRLGAQQVVVKGGDLDPACSELGHHRRDLGLCKDEIAHDDRGVALRSEGQPGPERESRL